MRMTFTRSMAVQMFGRIAPALLVAVMIIQPNSVVAKTLTGLELGQTLTVEDADPLSTAADEPVGPPAPPTAQEVLLDVCKSHGYGEDCAKALLGMMWKESRNIHDAVGDRGKALGYFQIHYRMHKVTRECATDLRCSADWTVKYMERNGYPHYVSYAVQCHNGCNAKNGYAASALRHGTRLWQEPMAVMPIALAAK